MDELSTAGNVASIVGLLKIILDAAMQYRKSRKRFKDRKEFVNALYSLTKHLDKWKGVHAYFFELDNDNLTNIIHQIDNGDYRPIQPYIKSCEILVRRFRIEVLPFFTSSGSEMELCETQIDRYMGIIANNMTRVSSGIFHGREYILDYHKNISSFSFGDLISWNERGAPFADQESYRKIVAVQHLATNIVGVSDMIMRESIPILNFLIDLLASN